MREFRQYLSGASVSLVILMLGAAAFAAPNTEKAHKDESAVSAPSGDDVENESSVEASGDESSVEASGDESADNHGHCVSYWAHQAKAQGLQGNEKGAFVSSIGSNADAVAPKVENGGTLEGITTCDFQAALDTAKAASAELESDGAGNDESEPEGDGVESDSKVGGKDHGKGHSKQGGSDSESGS